MKVYINRTPRSGPWGGGNAFVRAFHTFAPKHPGLELLEDKTMIIDPNVVLLAGLENEGPTAISAEQAVMYKMYRPGCKLVLRVNENDARKGTNHVDDYLMKLFPHMDGIVFVSNWLRDYFKEKGWTGTNDTVIYNGVDTEVFKPGTKFNDGKLHIAAHHWSDNPLKGADMYEKVDEFVGKNLNKYEFTYIGRHQCEFKHTKVIKPLSGKSLGEELGKHDVYVSASRFDPGPNHILEALACNLPTYVHSNGGGCVEFAGAGSTYDSWEQLAMIFEHFDPALQVRSRSCAIVPQPWQTCIQEYNDFLEATWKAST